MRSTQSLGPDHLPAVVDPEGGAKVPARKRAQAAHPILVAPDEGMYSRRAARCTDHLPRVIDGVGFTSTMAGKNAQILNDRSIFPHNSAVIAVGKAGGACNHARIVYRCRFTEIRPGQWHQSAHSVVLRPQ